MAAPALHSSPESVPPSALTSRRLRLAAWVESARVQRVVTALIVLNAVTLGLETSPSATSAAGPLLHGLDRAFLAAFVVELVLKLLGRGAGFFRSSWNVFDLAVVAVSLVPAAGALSVLRALRVVRVFRLLTVIPKMRIVVSGLLSAIPGLSSVAMLMGVVFYVAAVIATNLFGPHFPDWFGNVGRSMYTLFQVMTLESWSMGIVRPVMERFPFAWVFFVPFIVVATFTMLNLFIGIIVSAIQSYAAEEAAEIAAAGPPEPGPREILAEIAELRRVVEALAPAQARTSDPRGDGVTPPG
ncbi:ion transporter [Myxococcota bacterium]|nr:ion transporter [Myxococcota bacterium]